MTIPAPDSSWSKIMGVQLLPSRHQILTPQSDHTGMLRYYTHIHCLHIGALVEFTSGNINPLSVSYCREGVCMLCMMCLLLWSTQQVPWASEIGPSHDTIISIALPSYFGVICTSRDASREQSLAPLCTRTIKWGRGVKAGRLLEFFLPPADQLETQTQTVSVGEEQAHCHQSAVLPSLVFCAQ